MRIVLGSAQFGSDYGISNKVGRLSGDAVKSLLTRARSHGIDTIDTACLYGDAESVLGESLGDPGWKIVTKTPKFTGLTGARAVEGLRAAFDASLERLRRDRLQGLLAHDADDLLGPHGPRIWRAMQDLRADGRVGMIGASVYTGGQIDGLLARYDLDLIQLPLNMLDRRLVDGGQLEKLLAAGVTVHARSVFLQGLLLMPPEGLPPRFADIAPRLRVLRERLSCMGLSPVEGALAAVRAGPEIDAIVVGVTSTCELDEIVSAAERIAGLETDLPFEEFAVADATVLDPQHWPDRRPQGVVG